MQIKPVHLDIQENESLLYSGDFLLWVGVRHRPSSIVCRASTATGPILAKLSV